MQSFAEIDLLALNSWLQSRPPRTLLAYLDRLIVATVGDLPERAMLLKRGDEMLAYIKSLAEWGFLVREMTNACILIAVLQEEGVDTAECKSVVQSKLDTVRHLAANWSEPYRSTFFYWQARAGCGPDVSLGPDPGQDLLRLYYTTHRVFFGTDYGRKSADRSQFNEALNACLPILNRHPENGDALAEMLLAEAILIPRNTERCEMLRTRLAQLQRPDGRIEMPVGATPDAQHHAACVTLLAQKLLEESARIATAAQSNCLH